MKHSSTRDWLIDLGIIVGLAAVAVCLWPVILALFAKLSLLLGRTLFLVQFVALDYLLPDIIIGSLLGLAAAWLIRHRSMFLASLPSVLLLVFYLLAMTFGPYPYSWGKSWLGVIVISSGLLSIAASLLCARVVLRKRQSNTALEPTPTAP